MFVRILFLLLPLLAMAACVSTQEIPLSQNSFQLEVSGSGLVASAAVPDQVLQRAAQGTLQRGYTHFELVNPTTSTDRRFAGLTSANTAIMQRTRSTSVTVMMFQEGQNSNAIDARTIAGA